jgi:hypothetical protein
VYVRADLYFPTHGDTMKRNIVLWVLLNLLLTGLLVPAPLQAQDVPSVPAVVTQSEAPVTLIGISDSRSWSFLAPGRFLSICPA